MELKGTQHASLLVGHQRLYVAHGCVQRAICCPSAAAAAAATTAASG